MQIKADEKNLSQLFSGTSTFTIPDYQRNYAWKKDQVEVFLADFFEMVAKDKLEDHFFGPIVVLANEKEELSVVDGQQRLTTTFMFLALVRDIVSSLKDKRYVVADNEVDLNFLLTMMLKHSDMATDRFVANYQIRNVVKTRILAAPGGVNRQTLTRNGNTLTPAERSATSELRAAYFMIKTRLEDHLRDVAGNEEMIKSRLYRIIRALQENCSLLEIRMFSEDDAYLLFETLNDRGLRLTPSDILKNYTLRLANQTDETDITEVLDRWDTAVQTLGDFPFTKFLRHFLLSVQNKKVQSKTILKQFRERIAEFDKHSGNGALRNLTELEDATVIYAMLLGDPNRHQDPEVADAIDRLNLISETHRVFLLRVFRGTYGRDDIRRAVRATEMMAFRWILTGGNGQEIESHYQASAMLLGGGTPEELEMAIDFLLSKLPADDAVMASMTTSPAGKDMRMYVMRRLNMGLTGSEWAYPVKQVTIEFLAPEKPAPNSHWFISVAPQSSSDPNIKVYSEFAQKWGNIAVIEFPMTAQKRNADWVTKTVSVGVVKGLRDSQIPLTKEVADLPDWNVDSINSRTMWVADALVRLTTRSTVDETPERITPFV
jgi:hypothetical protein